MVDIATVVTAVAGSSLIAGYLQLQGERRQGRVSRSEILKALSAVEEARWADGTNSMEDFNKAARGLELAAIVTGVRQDVTEAYLAWAYVAAHRSYLSLEEAGGDPEIGGSISGELAKAVAKLARLVSDSAWRPIHHKLRAGDDLGKVEVYLRKYLPYNEHERAARSPWRRHTA